MGTIKNPKSSPRNPVGKMFKIQKLIRAEIIDKAPYFLNERLGFWSLEIRM